MKLFLLISFFFVGFGLQSTIYSQEDCFNAIDDDGDGLIDANDDDCLCCPTLVGEMIQNGSIEDLYCCSTEPGCYGWNDMNTSDGYHPCMPMIPNNVLVPFPGSGGVIGGAGGAPVGVEGIWQCLDGCMLPGTYNYSFYYYAAEFGTTIPVAGNLPVLGIFGMAECEDFSNPYFDCSFTGLDLLATITTGPNPPMAYVLEQGSFSSPTPYKALLLAPLCNSPTAYYILMTEISITGGTDPLDFEEPIQMGSNCLGYTFEIPFVTPGATVQWYIDGIAVVGANGMTFSPPIGTEGVVTYGVFLGDLCKYSMEYEIFGPEELTVSIFPTEISCFGAGDGVLSGVALDGIGPFEYSWSSGQSDNLIEELGPGVYSLTVTDQAGCTGLAEYSLTEPDELQGEITDITNADPITGYGGATVIGVGGTSPYSYEWSNAEMTSTATFLLVGYHTVTITDSRGCDTVLTIEIIESPALDVDVVEEYTCKSICEGIAEITINGDTSGLTILWEDSSLQGFLVDSLCSGVYRFYIENEDGIIYSDSVIIEDFVSPDILDSIVPSLCFKDPVGGITVDIQGGFGPFEIIWSNGGDSTVLDSLYTGSYSVSVIDSLGCIHQDSFVVDNQILPPDKNIDSITCFGGMDGSIDLNVNGFNSHTFIEWAFGDSSFIVENLEAGVYNYTLIDTINTCIWTDSITLIQPPQIEVLAQVSDTICNGINEGIISLDTTGYLEQGMQVLWSNGSENYSLDSLLPGMYGVTITDDDGCMSNDTFEIISFIETQVDYIIQSPECQMQNGSIQVTNTSLLNIEWEDGSDLINRDSLPSGVYYFEAQDSNQCLVRDTIVLFDQNNLVVSSMIENQSCKDQNDGSIILDFNDSTLVSDILWSTGDTAYQLQGLLPGNYSVNITDSLGCTSLDTFTIEEADVLDYTIQIDTIECKGEFGSIEVVSQELGLEYQWSTGDIASKIENLSQGTYTVVIQDSNSCYYQDTVLLIPKIDISFDLTIPDTICQESEAGMIEIQNGSNWNYLWSTGDTTLTISGVSQGWYFVTVSDPENRCQVIDSVKVVAWDLPIINYMVEQPLCGDNPFGSLSAQIGVVNITNDISFTPPVIDRELIGEGNYFVEYVDANQCVQDTTIEIVAPEILIVEKDSINPTCFNQANGSIFLNPQGGLPGYSIFYEEDVDQNIPLQIPIENLLPGAYDFTVVDQNGCEQSVHLNLSTYDSIPVNLVHYDIYCDSLNGSGSIILQGINGVVYPIQVNQGQIVFDTIIDGLTTGTYDLSLIHSDECIQFIGSTEIQFFSSDVVVEMGENSEQIEIGSLVSWWLSWASSYDLEYINMWFNDSLIFSDSEITALIDIEVIAQETNRFFVEVKDLNGCIETFEFIFVGNYKRSPLILPNIFSPNSDDVNDVWRVEIPSYLQLLSAQIFDRWGNKVYQTNQYTISWDGKLNGNEVESGVYVYFIELLDSDSGERLSLSGDITVIR